MATNGWSGEVAPAVAGDDMSIVLLTCLGTVAGLVDDDSAIRSPEQEARA